ncbi:hypothetical protein [Xenorhabdus siamensis]|uniref:hypothetical protein n=1 Tax=Xenorhabdus siamensis TaxID=3136254 RepID=UPI0030F46C83
MKFNKELITKEKLIELRNDIECSNQQMANLLGVSLKTWLNKISDGNSGKINKLEYEFLLLLAGKHSIYLLKNRKDENDFVCKNVQSLL